MTKLAFAALLAVLTSSTSIVTTALAADPNAAPQWQRGVVGHVPYNWSGFYAGISGGMGKGTALEPFQSTEAPTFNGRFIGGQFGANLQHGSLVFGIETDFHKAWTSSSEVDNWCSVADCGFNASTSTTTALDWMGSTRLRVGFVAYERFMAYATAGLAYGMISNKMVDNIDLPGFKPFVATSTQPAIGWTVGGGLEYAVLNSVSAKAEYRYTDLGAGTSQNVGTRFTDHKVLIGLNLHARN